MCKFKFPEIPTNTTPEEKARIMFESLCALNLNDKIEKRNGLSYLSWSSAWLEFKSAYPTATYEIKKNPATGLPYFSDPNIGIMVFTSITVEGITHEMWLPVMDAKNKAMKEAPYAYSAWNAQKKCYEEKIVEAASMFDVNKTLMRCLTKNMAMFGLGLYIYNGDDLPQANEEGAQKAVPQAAPKPYDRYATIKDKINKASDINALLSLYFDHQQEIDSHPEIKSLLTQRKQQLQLLSK